MVEEDLSGLLELFLADLATREAGAQDFHGVGFGRAARASYDQPDHHEQSSDPDGHPDPAVVSPGHHQTASDLPAGPSPAPPEAIREGSESPWSQPQSSIK